MSSDPVLTLEEALRKERSVALRRMNVMRTAAHKPQGHNTSKSDQ
jgi:hypothetical protein